MILDGADSYQFVMLMREKLYFELRIERECVGKKVGSKCFWRKIKKSFYNHPIMRISYIKYRQHFEE
jgi:hypothetical protein